MAKVRETAALMARIDLLTSSANQQLLNDAIRHAVLLERYKAGEVTKILNFLNKDVLPDMTNKLTRRLEDIALRGFDKGAYSSKKLREALAQMKEISRGGIHAAGAKLRDDLKSLALTEAEWQTAALARAGKPLALSFTMPSITQLHAVVTSKPFEGAILSQWVAGISRRAASDIERAIKIGIANGETTQDIVSRIVGTRGAAFKDGVYNSIRKNVNSVVRTSITHVSSDARELVYNENEKYIKGVQWLSTLDSRTTDICISLDGEVFEIYTGPRPPAHHQCRSTAVPVLKSWKEMGFTGLKKPPAAVRSSFNGEVPATITYPQWLKSQRVSVQNEALGVGRAKLWRAGKITNLKQLVDQSGRAVSLSQFQKELGVKVTAPSVGRKKISPRTETISARGERLKVKLPKTPFIMGETNLKLQAPGILNRYGVRFNPFSYDRNIARRTLDNLEEITQKLNPKLMPKKTITIHCKERLKIDIASTTPDGTVIKYDYKDFLREMKRARIGTGSLKVGEASIDWTMQHEFAHAIKFQKGKSFFKTYPFDERGITDYARTAYAKEPLRLKWRKEEHFAEAFSAFLKSPEALKEKAPRTYEWLMKHVFTKK